MWQSISKSVLKIAERLVIINLAEAGGDGGAGSDEGIIEAVCGKDKSDL